jgi:transcriptional regulator with XRE-family HTH domain
VGEPISAEAGRALRRIRTALGLTLQDVGERSGRAFTPTAVAGYERGERQISLQRFCDLATFYGIAPEQLLAEVRRALPEREDLVDLTLLEQREPLDA